MGSTNDFLGYLRLFAIKHLKKCAQSSGSFHKCSNNLRPTLRALILFAGGFCDPESNQHLDVPNNSLHPQSK